IMAYTASALSFMLQNLNKPVVLTGSQLPIGEIRNDAKENLITALEIAATKGADGSAMVPEVTIYFDYQLFRGNRAIKYNSDKFEAFQSPNYPLLAEAGVNLEFYKHNILQPNGANLELCTNFNASIGVLKMYPGITPQAVKAVTEAAVDAIVLETFGAGNTTTDQWFLDCVGKAIKEGKVLVDISQCKRGSVQLGKYETSSKLKDLGVVSGFDLTFEATITKLMYLLGKRLANHQVNSLMEQNLNGELTN
ncbi:MAG: L-asparaginase 1, partial [Pedobacter sp.]